MRYWDGVRALVVSGLDEPHRLSAHGLGLLGAAELERRGEPVPEFLQRQARLANVRALTTPVLLRRVREACDGPILVLKGPEVAARYPDEARGFGDLDLLVPDAMAAQRSLLAAGFVEEPDPDDRWVGIHHLPRLRLPGMALAIEVHSKAKWPDPLEAPPNEELFEAAIPSGTGVEGILAPAPAHHVLLLAAHAWAHQPLGQVRDLVDVGALRAEIDDRELAPLARRWRLARVWGTTGAALDALLARTTTWPLRLWASHLRELREQTVVETHLERLLAPIWGYPPALAARGVGAALVDEVRPAFDEDWGEKLRRTATALRRPFVPVTEHRRQLGDSATRGQRRNTPDGDDE